MNNKKFSSFFAKTVLSAFALVIVSASFASADTLYRQLELGMSGSDVSSLQTFLAGDVTLYPQGLVTGYFGFLTKAAVSNFQTRNGISAVGRVGPATLPVLNAQMANGMGNGNGGDSMTAPVITSVRTNSDSDSVTIDWNTNESAKGVVYYSTSRLVTTEYLHSVDVSGYTAQTDSNFRTSQSVSINNLKSNTTYYYMIYTTDSNGNVTVTWPSSFETSN